MSKLGMYFTLLYSILLLQGCATVASNDTDPTVMYTSGRPSAINGEPYWSNHYFDTGYGYHNMGYWGQGSWDIGSFRNNREPL